MLNHRENTQAVFCFLADSYLRAATISLLMYVEVMMIIINDIFIPFGISEAGKVNTNFFLH